MLATIQAAEYSPDLFSFQKFMSPPDDLNVNLRVLLGQETDLCPNIQRDSSRGMQICTVAYTV
jgi:hypothetical protein